MCCIPPSVLNAVRPFRALPCLTTVLIVLLITANPAMSANYNANDESRLNTAATVNDPSGALNWNPSPATSSDWTGVNWVCAGGEDRVYTINVPSMQLEGNLDLSNMTSLRTVSVSYNNLS
ncbi:hypothetical protein LJC59_04405, partial [Desulfovibrio sp. OttesenSCG-928-A18]|nr:hypothetical protein [Desulfovibrio sp. OttesenSCG-928-A18]